MFQGLFADTTNTVSNQTNSLFVIYFLLSNDSMGYQSNGMSKQWDVKAV